MFERFTDRARRAVVLAQEEARDMGHEHIGTEHLLLGLISEGEGVAAKALIALGGDLESMRDQARAIAGAEIGGRTPRIFKDRIPFTPRAKKIMELSLREALQLSHNYIGTEHLLLGLLRESEGGGARVLQQSGIVLEDARNKVVELLRNVGLPASAPPAVPEGPVPSALMSEALVQALVAARSIAGEHATGTHHVLLAFSGLTNTAAHHILDAGGFDAGRLPTTMTDWDLAGTDDESETAWVRRATEVRTEEGEFQIGVADDDLRRRIAAAVDDGTISLDEIQQQFGEFLRDLDRRSRRPDTGDQDGEDDGS